MGECRRRRPRRTARASSFGGRSSAADFNGTVVVEWLNVTSGMDADPDFGFAHDASAWPTDTAYAVRVGPAHRSRRRCVRDRHPGHSRALPLKEWDPERYGQLGHPGDDYSYDIFSQAAQAFRRPNGVDPMGDLDPVQLIAAGESQSAGRMVTYVNAVHPEADIYDGFLIHSRGGSGAVISAGGARMPRGAHIRDDLDDPVMQVETETDLFGLGFYAARQPDTEMLRTWEIAGTAHADQCTLDYGFESGRQYEHDDRARLHRAVRCDQRWSAGCRGPQGVQRRWPLGSPKANRRPKGPRSR